MADQPAYVTIANSFAQKIRNGTLPARTRLPSLSDIQAEHDVSGIVARQAYNLLEALGLIRSVARKGYFVADRPTLTRVSPERQMEGPEETFAAESTAKIHVDREISEVPASEEQALQFGLPQGTLVKYVVTRVSEGRTPVSISDTYHPIEIENTHSATDLEETLSDRLPSAEHAAWLGVPPGSIVRSVEQRFIAGERVIMLSSVTYPKDRYAAFVYRMRL